MFRAVFALIAFLGILALLAEAQSSSGSIGASSTTSSSFSPDEGFSDSGHGFFPIFQRPPVNVTF